MGHATGGGGGGGGQNFFQLQSQFQRFLYQTLCVFPQIKDVKHIVQNLYSVIWVMSQWWDLGAGGQKFERGDLRWRPIDCTF